MKKLIVLFLGSCSLMACATWQQQQQPAFDWRGQNFDDYVLKYGVPTSQYVLQSGNVAYSFVEQCTYNPGQAETTVMVNAENIITSISQKGTCLTAAQARQEWQNEEYARERAARKERHAHNDSVSKELESVNSRLKYYETEIHSKEISLSSAQSDLSLVKNFQDSWTKSHMCSVEECEENIKKIQAELTRLRAEKERLEREKAQLETSYWQ